MRRRTFVIGLAALPLLGACGGSPAGVDTAALTPVAVAMVAAELLSPELRTLSEHGQSAYRYAAANTDTLRHIPCYCGCGSFHKSVSDCFVHARRADGTVEWDMHGSGCKICQNVVLDSVAMLGQGRPLRGIRAAIDAAYRQYGEPTEAEPVVE